MGNNYAWVLEVRPGYEDEYKRRHDEIWPDLQKDIQTAGIRNYNIFRHGLTLFGYFECDDLPAAIQFLNDSDANKRWGTYMAPIMKVEVDSRINFPFLLPLMFHQD